MAAAAKSNNASQVEVASTGWKSYLMPVLVCAVCGVRLRLHKNWFLSALLGCAVCRVAGFTAAILRIQYPDAKKTQIKAGSA